MEGLQWVDRIYQQAVAMRENPPPAVLDTWLLDKYIDLLEDLVTGCGDVTGITWDEFAGDWTLNGVDEDHCEGVRWDEDGVTFSFSLRDFSNCSQACRGCEQCKVQNMQTIHRHLRPLPHILNTHTHNHITHLPTRHLIGCTMSDQDATTNENAV